MSIVQEVQCDGCGTRVPMIRAETWLIISAQVWDDEIAWHLCPSCERVWVAEPGRKDWPRVLHKLVADAFRHNIEWETTKSIAETGR